jgi:hypothetical protein
MKIKDMLDKVVVVNGGWERDKILAGIPDSPGVLKYQRDITMDCLNAVILLVHNYGEPMVLLDADEKPAYTITVTYHE